LTVFKYYLLIDIQTLKIATHLTMDRPSPDSAPQRPAMVLKKQIANNSPIQLKKKATEMKVLQK
jgi:hypothetical protein